MSTKFTVIDSSRGIAPRPALNFDPQIKAHLAALQKKAEGRDAARDLRDLCVRVRCAGSSPRGLGV